MQCCPEDSVSGGGGANVALRTLLVGGGGCNVALRSLLGGGVQCCFEDMVSGGCNVALKSLCMIPYSDVLVM